MTSTLDALDDLNKAALDDLLVACFPNTLKFKQNQDCTGNSRLRWEKKLSFLSEAAYLGVTHPSSSPWILKKKKVINLAAPGLSCSTWDLRSSLQHEGFLVAACGIFSCGMWDLVP